MATLPQPERPETQTVGSSPARRLSEVRREGMDRHFRPTDPRVDLLMLPVVGAPLTRAAKSRRFQFAAILPNQIVFWVVIVTGLVGAALPDQNFSTVITWFVWFCVVFLLMVGVGRAWCLMCPFGGAAEWMQRLSFWRRHPISIGLHRTWPESWSRFGLLPSLGVFVLLTWVEEFFNIAGPGQPIFTSVMVLSIIALAVATYLVFDRRTFCRYLCPLSCLIGSVGASGMVAGMRTRDRERCVTCPTKDCMRGSERGYPCPWYEWPGSATSNLMCGLCTECVKNCPYDNVGIYVQPPLTSVVAPLRRRLDIAVVVVVLFGLVVFQQVNAMAFYGPLDRALNSLTHFPGYPNPIDYLGIIAILSGAVVAGFWGLKAVFARRVPAGGPGAMTATQTGGSARGFGAWFIPLAYALIPLMAADYLARQLPKFWLDAPKLIAAISDPFGFGWNLFGTAHLQVAQAHILGTQGVITSQVALIGLGAAGAVYAAFRIVRRDLAPLTNHPRALIAAAGASMAVLGAVLAGLYVAMGAAT
jgi:NosR/NirI family nitrous oxide reductase transcriptional regulator